MNSSQRRKTQRSFPYSIKVYAESGLRYFEHDDKVMTARNWCQHNTKDGYKVSTRWDYTEFKFASEKDAVIFALKWI